MADISGTNNFINNSAFVGGGVYALSNATVYISGTNNFINNSTQVGGGVYAVSLLQWRTSVELTTS